MAKVVGVAKYLVGKVVALRSDGGERELEIEDEIFAEDVIRASIDARIDVAMSDGESVHVANGQSWLVDPEAYSGNSESVVAEATVSVDALQAAIEAGMDPTAIAKAPAAGGGGLSSVMGGDGVWISKVERVAEEVTPVAGYEIEGLGMGQDSVLSGRPKDEYGSRSEQGGRLEVGLVNNIVQCVNNALNAEVAPPGAKVIVGNAGIVTESGNAYLTYDVKLSHPVGTDVQAIVNISGSAVAGEDYARALEANDGKGWEPVIEGAVTLFADARVLKIRVPVKDDAITESNESVILNVSTNDMQVVDDSDAGVGTISDDRHFLNRNSDADANHVLSITDKNKQFVLSDGQAYSGGEAKNGWYISYGGNETIFGSEGKNYVLSGGGSDYLKGKGGNDFLNGQSGSDIIYGDAGQDVLYGGPGSDILSGGAGNDISSGGGGDDRIYGGADSDVLTGGAGNDILSGGGGEDLFVWVDGDQGVVARPAEDSITDFKIIRADAEGSQEVSGIDKLDLSDILDFKEGDDITDFLHIEQVGEDAKVQVSKAGRVKDLVYEQVITLQNVNLSEFGANDQDIITSLINNENLVVD